MGFTSDACWFLLIKTLLIKKIIKKRGGAKIRSERELRNVVFLLGLIQFMSDHAYYQYFLQALMPAPTFTLKVLV